MFPWLNLYGMIFHEQQACGYGFPSQPLATCASAGVSEPLVLKNHSDTSAEARVARGSDGKPYPHSCCSYNQKLKVETLKSNLQ